MAISNPKINQKSSEHLKEVFKQHKGCEPFFFFFPPIKAGFLNSDFFLDLVFSAGFPLCF